MFGWLTGLLGIPQVISSALNTVSSALGFLSPLLSKGLELIGWLLSTLWEGAKDILDNAATVFTVMFIALCSWFYGAVPAKLETAKCEKTVEVQKVYIEKQCPKPKVIYKSRPQVQDEFRWPWDFGG